MTPRPSEDELIARFFAPLAGPSGLGLKDDVALLKPPPGRDLVLTTDALVAGVHFFADDPAGAIARKALRVNLSDLAAKGAAPLGFLLVARLAARLDGRMARRFRRGARRRRSRLLLPADGRRHGQDARAADAFDHRARRGRRTARMVARTGVQAGDRLYVSRHDRRRRARPRGPAGAGPALGEADRAFLLDRYLLPRPRSALAPAIAAYAQRRHGCLRRLCRRSQQDAAGHRRQRARRDRERCRCLTPRARRSPRRPNLFTIAATGGDDYELLVSVAARGRGRLRAAAADGRRRRARTSAKRSPGRRRRVFVGPDGGEIRFARGSFSHF